MKKLLLSSIVLLLFSSSILLFQVSCQKEANANPTNITTQNKIVYIKALNSGNNEIWTANIDGTNQQKIPIVFPADYELEDDGGSITLTADNQKIIFAMGNTSNQKFVYSCNIDGSNLVKIIDDNAGHYSIVAY